eukprot:GILJ01006335.1.p1 GENE.GILJ01006335.1~~GILJ01006335.1.p1  ORF type:complete len:450 (-),score=58.43 GILJ01006335.1:16-1338(-)
MKIAIEGCGHGELDHIYETVKYIGQVDPANAVDLLICCGDFECMRNESDMECLACPPKYRAMKDFYQYYTGEKVAPVLTIFIGGNHEASNYLRELYYGGWVAPNIYFLGYSGVVQVGGVRIAGLSGIYKPHDYRKGHHEVPPYTDKTMRSAYHVREYEVFKLMQIREPVDIFLSHDWPKGIARYGNVQQLLRFKKYLADEINNDSLGNPAGQTLMQKLKPSYWFSAHMHVKFPAVVPHDNGQVTRFLALDKCLPRRDFLQVVTIPSKNETVSLTLDPEWLCVLSNTHSLLSNNPYDVRMPWGDSRYLVTEAQKAAMEIKINSQGGLPLSFVPTARAYDPKHPVRRPGQPAFEPNPQHMQLLAFLELDDRINAHTGSLPSQTPHRFSTPAAAALTNQNNEEEIDIDDIPDDTGAKDTHMEQAAAVPLLVTRVENVEEIDIE